MPWEPPQGTLFEPPPPVDEPEQTPRLREPGPVNVGTTLFDAMLGLREASTSELVAELVARIGSDDPPAPEQVAGLAAALRAGPG